MPDLEPIVPRLADPPTQRLRLSADRLQHLVLGEPCSEEDRAMLFPTPDDDEEPVRLAALLVLFLVLFALLGIVIVAQPLLRRWEALGW